MLKRQPNKIIRIGFEELIISPKRELSRICGFLEIKFEKQMLIGTMNTGYTPYNRNFFDLSVI